MTNVRFPFQIDRRGRTATASDEQHLRDLIEQVLFTAPGERVNRPTFGSGLMQLVFAPESDALVAATQLSVQASLQQWLGDLIQVEAVEVTRDESTLRVRVAYIDRRADAQRLAEFTRNV